MSQKTSSYKFNHVPKNHAVYLDLKFKLTIVIIFWYNRINYGSQFISKVLGTVMPYTVSGC